MEVILDGLEEDVKIEKTTIIIQKKHIRERPDVQVATPVGDPKFTEGSNLTGSRDLKSLRPGVP